jgi:hypothetical protein
MEQLFEGRDQAADIIERAADCNITWRDVEGLCLSPAWRRRMRDRVRRAEPKFEDYGGPLRNYEVLVKVSSQGWTVRVTGSPDAHAVFRRYLDPPPTVVWDQIQGPQDLTPAILEEVKYRRARARFTLHRLYELRNEIVHQALAYRVDVEVLARELERVLDDVLGKLIALLENPPPEPPTVEAAQRMLDKPWM